MAKKQFPGLGEIPYDIPGIRSWLSRVKEIIERREGVRGTNAEQAVTWGDLADGGLTNKTPSGVIVISGSSIKDNVVASATEASKTTVQNAFNLSDPSYDYSQTSFYKEIISAADAISTLSKKSLVTQQQLASDIAKVSQRQEADVSVLEAKIQTTEESLAYQITNVSAALDDSNASIQNIQVAQVTDNQAFAQQITEVNATLSNYPINTADIDSTVYANLSALTSTVTNPDWGKYYQVDNPSSTDNDLYRYDGAWVLAGTGTSAAATATVTQVLQASVDRLNGIAADYSVKVNANGYIAGFGVSATKDPNGTTNSSFIILADKFAVVKPSDSIPDPNNPPSNRVPFAIDSTGVYIKTDVRIYGSIFGGSATGYMSGTGLFAGVSSGTYKFHVGDPSGKNFHWDGSALTVDGEIIATSNIYNNAVTVGQTLTYGTTDLTPQPSGAYNSSEYSLSGSMSLESTSVAVPRIIFFTFSFSHYDTTPGYYYVTIKRNGTILKSFVFDAPTYLTSPGSGIAASSDTTHTVALLTSAITSGTITATITLYNAESTKVWNAATVPQVLSGLLTAFTGKK